LSDKRVLAGSSGFTTSVMNDENYENFISIDDEALFDLLSIHHQRTIRDDNPQVISKKVR